MDKEKRLKLTIKKKLFVLLIIALLIGILFIIPRSTYEALFNKGSYINDDNTKTEQVLVFMKDKKGMVVGVKVDVDAIEEDEISQKFDILTLRENKDSKYETYINTNTSLIEHVLENGVLTLNFTSDFNESNGRKAIEQLAWTYLKDGINRLEIKIEDKIVHKVNDFYFDEITKDIGINQTLETVFFDDVRCSTVISYENDVLVPVTYYYNNTNQYEYIMSKIFSDYAYKNEFDFTFNKDIVTISFNSDIEVTDELKETLNETLVYNFNVSCITLNGADQKVLLEIKNNKDTI